MNHGSCPVASVGRVEHVGPNGFRVKAVGSFLLEDVEKGHVKWFAVPPRNEEIESLCDAAFFGYDETRSNARQEIKSRLNQHAANVEAIRELSKALDCAEGALHTAHCVLAVHELQDSKYDNARKGVLFALELARAALAKHPQP